MSAVAPEPESRPVVGVVTATQTTEGGGFAVRRPFPTPALGMVDPFLLLDEMGPSEYGPGEAVGAPDHPHRGFETVTYMLEGGFEHEDSAGHRGTIAAGDVQWMTAGAGVVHSEMPARAIVEQGGSVHGVQLWVNLRADEKMVPARYQDLRAADIPTVELPGGGTVRLIAGDALGVHGAARTHTSILYLHATLPAGARFATPVATDWNAFVYVLEGTGEFGPDRSIATDGQLAVFGPGKAVEVGVSRDASEPLDVLVLAGEPLREPVARYGPFVMNTRDEIVAAFDDYHAGRLGAIAR